MKNWVQNLRFKLGTIWWDIARSDNRNIWKIILVIAVLSGVLIGRQ